MFDKLKTEAEPVSRGEVAVAAVSGTFGIAVVGRRIRGLSALGVGCKALVQEFPMPPSGRVVALDAQGGPSALTSDGAVWAWQPASPGSADGRWEKIGNLLDPVSR
jgi:hypothetical protein